MSDYMENQKDGAPEKFAGKKKWAKLAAVDGYY